MSYQIKSTPFFRRMFNTSKKNGQLQRLREEYERIQEFNDRTIEMKMRQVRLKRLFREIEEIKDTQPTGSKRRRQGGSSLQPLLDRSPQTERIEALARAKELGKEMSRRNAVEHAGGSAGVGVISGAVSSHQRRFGGQSVSNKILAAAEARRQTIERRERTARRINYGNAQSKCNMQKIVQRRQRNQQSSTSFDGSSDVAGNEKRSKLMQRLAYGNARSTCNMARTAAAVRRGNNNVAIPAVSRRLKDAEATEVQSLQTGFSDVLEEPQIRSTTSSLSSDEQDEQGEQQQPREDALDVPDPLELRRKKTFLLNGVNTSPKMHKFAIIDGSENAAQAHWRRISNTLPWLKVFGRDHIEQDSASATATAIERTGAAVPISSNQSPTIGDEMLVVDDSSSYEDIGSTTVLDTSNQHIKAWQRAKEQEQALCNEVLHMAIAEEKPRDCLFEILKPCHRNADSRNLESERGHQLSKIFEH